MRFSANLGTALCAWILGDRQSLLHSIGEAIDLPHDPLGPLNG